MTDPEVARVLSDPDHVRYIAPFLEHERTVSDVAALVAGSLSTAYRRVRRYCELGILEIVREQPRAGKSIKVYRCVADAFFVPLALADGDEAVSTRWQAHWEPDLQRGFRHAYGDRLDGWGQRIYRKDGVLTTSLAQGPDEDLDVLEPDKPALYNRSHDSLYLDFADAKAFQRELDALFRRYAARRGQQRYVVRMALVPVPEDTDVIP